MKSKTIEMHENPNNIMEKVVYEEKG